MRADTEGAEGAHRNYEKKNCMLRTFLLAFQLFTHDYLDNSIYFSSTYFLHRPFDAKFEGQEVLHNDNEN